MLWQEATLINCWFSELFSQILTAALLPTHLYPTSSRTTSKERYISQWFPWFEISADTCLTMRCPGASNASSKRKSVAFGFTWPLPRTVRQKRLWSWCAITWGQPTSRITRGGACLTPERTETHGFVDRVLRCLFPKSWQLSSMWIFSRWQTKF